jgi:hypothetical protein
LAAGTHGLCSMLLSSKGKLSHLSDGTKCVSVVGDITPHRLGDGGARHHSHPRGGTVSSGASNIVEPTAGLFGLPTRQGIEPDQVAHTDREKYHARRGKRPTTTHRRK